MSKLEEYQAKKKGLESKLEQINREVILTEQSVNQQKEIFMQQFNTVEPDELRKISQQYQDSIVLKEQELAMLEQEVNEVLV